MDRSDPTARRVLLVEDCPDTAVTLAFLLELWGYDVRVALTGPAALAVCDGFCPAVVLLDLGLPGMDGLEVARQLRERDWPETPILVAATGYDGADVRRRARLAGFDFFLPKPFDLAHLRALLAAPAAVPA